MSAVSMATPSELDRSTGYPIVPRSPYEFHLPDIGVFRITLLYLFSAFNRWQFEENTEGDFDEDDEKNASDKLDELMVPYVRVELWAHELTMLMLTLYLTVTSISFSKGMFCIGVLISKIFFYILLPPLFSMPPHL
ncbi:hypothetical protein Aduo_006934 [Ancylostoma duodenale]